MVFDLEIIIINLVFVVALYFVIKKALELFQKWRVYRMQKKWKEKSLKESKVIVHAIWRCKTIPALSPFSFKLETYLRMANIPYVLDSTDPTGSKGKTPWISYNGTNVTDSHLIIQYLNKEFSVNLNESSSHDLVAAARACRIMLEEHFFWGMARYRLIDGVKHFPSLFSSPPVIPKPLLPFLLSLYITPKLNDNGIGRHLPSEIYEMTEADLRTASIVLADKKYFGGHDQPCEEDSALFGFISQALWGLPGSSFEKLLHGDLRNLKDYCERMKERFWPDWDDCLDKS